jgi:hypothetical protein
MEAALARGLSLFVDEDYEGALAALDQAAALDAREDPGRSADLLVKRAAVHAKLKQHPRALADADAALALDPKCGSAWLRRGTALFHLGQDFGAARQAFVTCRGLRGVGSSGGQFEQVQTWIRKCDAELSDMGISLPDESVEPTAPAAAPVPAPSAPTVRAATAVPASAPAPGVAAALDAAAKAPRAPARFPSDWYQSLTHVTVEVIAKGIKAEQVSQDLSARSAALEIRLSEQETISFEWELFGAIDPAQSILKVLPMKLELRLKKADESQHWPALEAAASAAAPLRSAALAAPAPVPLPAAAAAAPSARPSAYASKKNWDAIEKDLAKTDDKPEGEEALNKLFQDIYKNANEDTRRAMIKSMQTSGGTVLSTNWGEVASKNYEKERPAPKGMQWKSWEGDKLNVGDDDDDK